MTKNDLSFEDKVEMIASLIGDNFLRVARALREIQDDKPEIFLEIAKRLGIPYATAATRLHRARRMVRASLQDKLRESRS